jgi:brefeldin A-inhibited guanine nucleotide-exchange protein
MSSYLQFCCKISKTDPLVEYIKALLILANLYRIFNGLLKTALGVPPGSTTTLTTSQDQTFRIESVKCLATIIKSMGSWMDQQLRIGDFSPKVSEAYLNSVDSPNILTGEDGSGIDYELQSDSGSPDITGTPSLEQRRAFKIEFQVQVTFVLVLELQIVP